MLVYNAIFTFPHNEKELYMVSIVVCMSEKKGVRFETSKRYIETTKKALEKIVISPPVRSYLRGMAKDFLDMANNYFSDAEHFHNKGDYERALACVNYAHGWLDAGARIGLFDVGEDDQLFTLYE